jgi:hypothetical protein
MVAFLFDQNGRRTMTRSSAAVLAVGLMCPFALWAEKLPVPTDAALEGPLAVVKEVYGEQHSSAKTNEQLQALAKKLFSDAAKAGKPIERYAMLRVARDIAAQGCDGQTAFQIIDELERTFQIDAVRMKAGVLYSLTKKVRLPADRKSIAQQALALVELAVARDDFELSGKLAEMALAEARKLRDAAYVRSVAARNKEIEELGKAYAEVKAAAERLKESPTDPEANLAVGRYRCLVKSDWENGLPMLALGSDAGLKALALRELGEVTKPEQQVELADSWWRLAETHDGTQQTAMRRRAVYWYRRVIPVTDGLVQGQANRRIRQFYASHAETMDTRKDAILLLSCDRSSVARRQNTIYATDGSALANHGVVHGAELAREGKVGECFEFNGSGHSIEFPTLAKALQANLAGLTVAAWINPRVKKNDHSFVFDVGHHANNSVTLDYVNGDEMRFTMSADHGGHSVVHSGYPVDQWHHVAGVWNGSEQILYMNGVRVASLETPELTQLNPSTVSAIPARIGICAKRKDRRMGRWYFAGRIDEIVVFRRALSEDEVAAIYCRGEAGQSILPGRGR